MNLPDFSNPTSLLATGGVIAFVTAGWGQIKTWFSFLSGFIFISAEMDHQLSLPIQRYLKDNYTPLPSGMIRYVSRWFQFKDNPGCSVVPFRISPDKVIYRRGYHLLSIEIYGDICRIKSLRWLVDFDDLIVKALTAQEEQSYSKKDDTSIGLGRYQLIKVIGMEKTATGMGSLLRQQGAHGGVSSANNEPGTNGPSLIAGNGTPLDPNIDSSFMYPKDKYLFTVTSDPFENLFFPEEIHRYVHQAMRWLRKGDWYAERGIPWRRGWGLIGPGSTGKSSLARATAQKMGIPIYQYYLATLSDQEFMREWEGMQLPCVVLMEDFDTVFNGRVSLTEHKSLTFDCVLNQISGVGVSSGVFLIITSNHIEAIDPAMGVEMGDSLTREVDPDEDKGLTTRPGRLDTIIHFGNIDEPNRHRMAAKILRDWPELIDAVVARGDNRTPAQFQEMCLQLAFDRMQQEEDQ